MEDTIDHLNETLKNHYINQEFGQARDFIISHQVEFDAPLYHFQLGTVLYKLNSLAEARYHFEQADLLGMSGSELSNNLSVVKHQLNSQAYESVDSYAESLLYSAYHWPDHYYFSLVFLFLLVAGIFKILRQHVFIVLFFVLFSLAPIGFWAAKARSVILAVTKEETSIFEGPSAAFGSVRKLSAGIKILSTKCDENWCLIDYPSNFTGWVKLDELNQLVR